MRQLLFPIFASCLVLLGQSSTASALLVTSLTLENGTVFPTGFVTNVVEVVDCASCSTIEHGIVEVSLSGVSGPILSAVLTLDGGIAANGLALPNDFAIYGYVGDGAVTLADFGAGVFLGNTSWDGSPSFAIDVTSFTQTLVANSDPWLGINIRMPSTTPGGTFARFSGSSPQLPVLDVVVPEPSTALLLATGLAVLAVRRSRRTL